MITIKDVAREAGVSCATVSYVLNGKQKKARISEKSCTRIRETARRLGYLRNELARAVVTGHNNVIAFISRNTGTEEYTGKILAGIMDAASGHDYNIKLFNILPDKRDYIMDQVIAQRIAGALIHDSTVESTVEMIKHLHRINVPACTVNISNTGTCGYGVNSDDVKSSFEAVKYLIDLGHTRISHISHFGNGEYMRMRRQGYLSAMRKHLPGVEAHILPVSSAGLADNRPEIIKLLDKAEKKRPSAVFCVSDSVAMQVFQAAYILGIKIPEELSIMGFANLFLSRFTPVPLSTVEQPFEKMGYEAASVLIDSITNDGVDVLNRVQNRKVPGKLIIRESCSEYKQ